MTLQCTKLMSANEFLAFMDGDGGRTLREESEARTRELQAKQDAYFDAIGDLIEKHPIVKPGWIRKGGSGRRS